MLGASEIDIVRMHNTRRVMRTIPEVSSNHELEHTEREREREKGERHSLTHTG